MAPFPGRRIETVGPSAHPSSAAGIGDLLVRRLRLIGPLSEADGELLRGVSGTVQDLRRGEEILKAGDRPADVVVVLSGLLQRCSMTADGKRQLHSVYLRGDTPSLETLHIGVMDSNLVASAPSRVALVPHAELDRVMRASPNVLALLWRETLVQASIYRTWLVRNSQMLAHAQLAHFFCEFITRAEAAGLAERGCCDLPMTQEDLADALGMTPIHINRTLMLLRAGGMIEFQGGRLRVPDRAKLTEVAAFDPAYLHYRQPVEHGSA